MKYSGRLVSNDLQHSAAILKILHVSELNCVLVSLTSSEIWSVHDRLIGKPPSLVKEQKITTSDRDGSGPVYDLVKINIDGQLQVWGTMDNNTLLLLQKKQHNWSKHYYDVHPYSHHLKVCSHIVCCSFTDDENIKHDHLWISYRSKGGIVCFDARNKAQRGSLNCSEILKSNKGILSIYNHFDDSVCRF